MLSVGIATRGSSHAVVLRVCVALLAAVAGASMSRQARAIGPANPTIVAIAGPPTWYTGNGGWSVGTNWTSGVAPNGAGAAAVLGITADSAVTVTLDSAVTLGMLALGNTAQSSSMGYTVIGSNGLTLNNSGDPSQINVSEGAHAINAPVTLAGELDVSLADGSTFTIGGNIGQSGVSSLILTSGGELILGGDNGYTGGTLVEDGVLLLDSPNALFAGTGLTVGGGSFTFDSASGGLPFAASPASVVASSPASIVAAVPEPGTLLLLGVAVCGAAVYQRTRSRGEKQ